MTQNADIMLSQETGNAIT